MPSEAQTYYDAYWSSGFSPVDMELPETLRGVFERYVQAGDKAIDVGCGDGSKAAASLSACGASYRGFDVSHEGVELARRRGLTADVVQDASSLPLVNDEVDVAVCAEVLEHLFDPFAAITEIRRVLSPGGLLILTVPNVVNWRSRLDFAFLGRWHPGGDVLSVEKPWRDPHIRFFSRAALGRMLQEAGYAVLELGGVQDVSVAVRMPVARVLLGNRPAGRPTRLLTRWAPGVFANHLYAVARA